MTYLATALGRCRSAKATESVISDAATDAGIPKSAHGLRKTHAKKLAEAGGTVHQIASRTGHITFEEVEHHELMANCRAAVRCGSVRGKERKVKVVNH